MKVKYPLAAIAWCLFFMTQATSFAQVPAEKPAVNALKIDKPVELSGKLDNPVWALAETIELNYEVLPGENTPAPQKTEVKVLYDDKYLYFGFICLDSNPEQIRANITDRDGMTADDFVLVGIDTYGDYQKYYELAVNPYGIKADLLASNGGNEDLSFDMIWDAAAEINSKGWTAMMRIPFSSLNFSSAEEQNWVLAIIRCLPRASRIQTSWTPQYKNIPGLITQAGILKGLKNIKSGGNVELLPYLMGQKNGSIANPASPNSGFKYDPVLGRLGGGIKYSPSADLAIDAVINPDFSQIEADATQISVNTTFALQYEEKRPFFLTGRDLLQTPMYYSRSINDPLVAGRILGKTGALTYMYMGAQDRNTVFIIPGRENSSTIATDKKSIDNIGRLWYDLGNENYLGAMILARNIGDGHNYVFGADWKYKFWTNWYFSGETFLSQTKELNEPTLFNSQRGFGTTGFNAAFNGEEYSGTGIHLNLSKKGRDFGFSATYNNFSPTYMTYSGMFPNNDYQQFVFQPSYTFYNVNSFVDRLYFYLLSYANFDSEGGRKALIFQPAIHFVVKGLTNFEISYLYTAEDFYRNTSMKNEKSIVINASTRPVKEFTLFFNGTFGDFSYYSSTPEVGYGHNLSASIQLNLTSQLNLSLDYSRARLSGKKTDELFYDGNIYRGIVKYQFSEALFFRTILQYDSFEKNFQIYPLLSYKLNAFTTFFAGATSNYLNYGENYGFRNTEQQYFVKIQYLIGI